jgi:hypothetical protein
VQRHSANIHCVSALASFAKHSPYQTFTLNRLVQQYLSPRECRIIVSSHNRFLPLKTSPNFTFTLRAASSNRSGLRTTCIHPIRITRAYSGYFSAHTPPWRFWVQALSICETMSPNDLFRLHWSLCINVPKPAASPFAASQLFAKLVNVTGCRHSMIATSV